MIVTINIRNININYIQYGSGSDVVLLHGWGQNIAMMKPIGDRLQKNHRITILDFPGFGESEEPKTALTVYDYCEILEELLKKLKVKKPVIMGHSFGGRIAIIYASRNEVEKVILFGSPCIRKEVKPSLKLRMLKSLKKIPGIKEQLSFSYTALNLAIEIDKVAENKNYLNELIEIIDNHSQEKIYKFDI